MMIKRVTLLLLMPCAVFADARPAVQQALESAKMLLAQNCAPLITSADKTMPCIGNVMSSLQTELDALAPPGTIPSEAEKQPVQTATRNFLAAAQQMAKASFLNAAFKPQGDRFASIEYLERDTNTGEHFRELSTSAKTLVSSPALRPFLK